jgi:hypothetical protein
MYELGGNPVAQVIKRGQVVWNERMS